jgi:hypothetical protein
VSRAVTDEFNVPETGVRNRSQYAETRHHQDPDSNEPRPACPEAEYREDAEFTEVPVGSYPTDDQRDNPECSGREWR